MPLITVRHTTTYRYRRPVVLGEHRIMFRPRDSYDQTLLEARIDISPTPVNLHWVHDVFGNCVAAAVFDCTASELRFSSMIKLSHTPSDAIDFAMEDYAKTFPFSYDAEEMPDLLRSIERAYPDPHRTLDFWTRRFVAGPHGTHTVEMLESMTSAICREFQYVPRLEVGTQPPLATLERRSGTCRDFALLMMEAVRSLGLAARFVSGYLCVPGGRGGGNTHAWLQVYLPGAGWVEFDPTNGTVGSEGLIRVAVARTPRQATPLYGTWTGAASDCLGMDVEVDVTTAS